MNPKNMMSSSKQSAAPATARKSKGRQKVKMAKMENHSNLQVTFSKRRAGLFKKASELCTLCGAEAAIVVFSPANKAYCFGHPNFNAVVDRFAAGVDPPPPANHLIIDAHRNSNIRHLNIELTRLDTLLRAERRRAEEIALLRRHERWLPPSLEDLDHAQLAALKESVMGFKRDLDAKVQREMFRAANPLPNLYGNPNFVDNGFEFPKLSLGSDHLLPYSNGGVGGGDYCNYGWSTHGPPSSSSILPNHPQTNIFQMF